MFPQTLGEFVEKERKEFVKKRDGRRGGVARVAAGARRGTAEGPKSGSRSRKTDVMTHRLINRSTVSHRGFFLGGGG